MLLGGFNRSEAAGPVHLDKHCWLSLFIEYCLSQNDLAAFKFLDVRTQH